MTRLHAEEANGYADESDDLLSELVDRIRGIDHRLGCSPDPATGNAGSGLCKVVAELKAESDYRARVRYETEQRRDLWRRRIAAAAYLLTGLSVLLAGAWAIFRYVVLLVKP